MQCPRCQQENPLGAKFCNACGAGLQLICPSCGHPNVPVSRFCNECGQALGQVHEGLDVLTEALDVIRKTSECAWEAELYRIQGELLLAVSGENQTEAETCFHQAIEIARRQQAKSWELRAARSLARLWGARGKGDEARNLLAPVYGWFTEGFDTRDLREVKALLEELS